MFEGRVVKVSSVVSTEFKVRRFWLDLHLYEFTEGGNDKRGIYRRGVRVSKGFLGF